MLATVSAGLTPQSLTEVSREPSDRLSPSSHLTGLAPHFPTLFSSHFPTLFSSRLVSPRLLSPPPIISPFQVAAEMKRLDEALLKSLSSASSNELRALTALTHACTALDAPNPALSPLRCCSALPTAL
jgi:hypothetical protein